MSAAVPSIDDVLFQALEAHLRGGKRGILHDLLQEQCNVTGKSACALYQDAKISPDNLKKLRRLLDIPDTFDSTNGDTLFGWVQTLAQNSYGHGHLDDFHHLIKSIEPHESWEIPLFFATIATALSGIYLSLMPEHLHMIEAVMSTLIPIISHFLRTTFSVLRNIPLLLLINSALRIPFQAHYTLYHDIFRSPERRLQKWLAGTLPPVFSLVSYYLSYAANGAFPPLAICFFIASSLVGVINSLYNRHLLKPIAHLSPENKTLNDIREEKRYERTEATIKINLIASILVSINVVLWGLLPPSFVVTVGSILFINLVGFTKNSALTRIHTDGAADLQTALRAKESTDLAAENQALKTENAALKAENAALKRHRFFTPAAPLADVSSDVSPDYPDMPHIAAPVG